ncbi:hypothetical protein A8144_00605 [Mycobacterium leprae 3125609]|nr:hypothetical protein A8144_00605 [Mycobacterium leprae 3125609]OAX72280.1 hypothetical protein A3216_00670 [Mycobacterium leprae 7935681]
MLLDDQRTTTLTLHTDTTLLGQAIPRLLSNWRVNPVLAVLAASTRAAGAGGGSAAAGTRYRPDQKPTASDYGIVV